MDDKFEAKKSKKHIKIVNTYSEELILRRKKAENAARARACRERKKARAIQLTLKTEPRESSVENISDNEDPLSENTAGDIDLYRLRQNAEKIVYRKHKAGILGLSTKDVYANREFRASRRKVSPLWNHFDEVIPGKKAKCSYCNRILAVSASSIGSLARHMKSLHSTIPINSSRRRTTATLATKTNVANESDIESVDQIPLSIKSQQAVPKLVHYVQTKKCLPQNPNQLLHEQLIRMIAKGHHSLRIVDEVEFKKFVEMLNSGYTLPTRKTLSESIIPEVYKSVLEKVQKQIAKATAVCITTDAWMSSLRDGYIALTAHFIDVETDKLCTAMIGCIEFGEEHTDACIKNFLEAKFFEWDIQVLVNVVVSNTAANILNAVQLGGWSSLSCFAQTLNQVVQSSLDVISDTMRKVEYIIDYFHHSSAAKAKLAEIQEHYMNTSPLKLKNDEITCWSTTYNAFQRLLKIKDAVIATLEMMRPDIGLSDEDWLIVEKATELLQIFYEVTVEISSEQYVPASKYIVLCKIINRALNKYVPKNSEKIQQFYNSLKAHMEQWFGEVECNTILCEATILDPRFKKSGFSNIRNYEKAAADLLLQIGSDCTQTTVPQLSVVELPESRTSSIWDDFDTEISVLAPKNPTAVGIMEFNKYIEEPLIKRTENPLLWWRERKNLYPRLYSFMLRRLNVTATAVSCESVFSKAGLILNEKRTQLKTKKLSELLFISSN